MGFTTTTTDIADVKRAIWESGYPIHLPYMQVNGDTTPVFKITLDFTNINQLYYYLRFKHAGNNYEAKLTIDTTDEFSNSITGDEQHEGMIDTSGYTGEKVIKITMNGTADSGYLQPAGTTIGSYLMVVES